MGISVGSLPPLPGVFAPWLFNAEVLVGVECSMFDVVTYPGSCWKTSGSPRGGTRPTRFPRRSACLVGPVPSPGGFFNGLLGPCYNILWKCILFAAWMQWTFQPGNDIGSERPCFSDV